MPSALRPTLPQPSVTKFTNCRLVRGDSLVWEDVWVSSVTGKILQSQVAFYDEFITPDQTINLGGRIISPGFIDCQLNGAFGFNFSTLMNDMSEYGKQFRALNKKLVETGVTSYVPTVTSQTRDLYHKVLPYLAPSGSSRLASAGSESLGAHVEGPFISRTKNGIHDISVLQTPSTYSDLENVYGAANITPSASVSLPVKMITLAPELGQTTPSIIPGLRSNGIVVSIGHSEATFEEASAAVSAGATMITHLFNAMRPLHHRNPGIFGVLGTVPDSNFPRPYFGVIADGIHLHPTTVKIAWNAHPDGFILVTDAMHTLGLPDGRYEWLNGRGKDWIVKKGGELQLEGKGTIAGSSITLIECVNNFLEWSGASIPEGLKTVTATPAAMLGLKGVKGVLDPGTDADLVVLSEDISGGKRHLRVDEVWKFGVRVFGGASG
ncbi:putative N-acetylglucosamine-6-phosphate deacetylase [Podospora fimiseda]|uniref:N-acetylglucosamine-6-phosphate deacetylase n=1 Tax=Podospora fimiseda TaxID=252190 RepID=A0AAN7C0F5_9PEZI|nr:putative N-acetylglucosamine-6-phosphate deacetylase [Podospora fimiseda]